MLLTMALKTNDGHVIMGLFLELGEVMAHQTTSEPMDAAAIPGERPARIYIENGESL